MHYVVVGIFSVIAAMAVAAMLQVLLRVRAHLAVPTDVKDLFTRIAAGTLNLQDPGSRERIRALGQHYPGPLTEGLWCLMQAEGLPLGDVLDLLDRNLRRNLGSLLSSLQLLGVIYKTSTLVGLLGTLLLVATSIQSGQTHRIGEALLSTGLGVCVATSAAIIDHLGRHAVSQFAKDWTHKLEDSGRRVAASRPASSGPLNRA